MSPIAGNPDTCLRLYLENWLQFTALWIFHHWNPLPFGIKQMATCSAQPWGVCQDISPCRRAGALHCASASLNSMLSQEHVYHSWLFLRSSDETSVYKHTLMLGWSWFCKDSPSLINILISSLIQEGMILRCSPVFISQHHAVTYSSTKQWAKSIPRRGARDTTGLWLQKWDVVRVEWFTFWLSQRTFLACC